MSKLVEAIRKSKEANRLLEQTRSESERVELLEGAREAGEQGPERENVLEIEPGRDLIVTEEPLKHTKEELSQKKIIFPGMDEKATEDAFRDLRTLVTQKSGGGNAVILVTSVRKGGGSSFVSFNLGAAYAMDRTRTAIVLDCNFRRPAYYSELLNEGDLGISDFLSDPKVHADQIIQQCGIPRLRIIPSGGRRHDVADLVNSKRAERLVKDLKRRFRERMIIVDAAPITQSADSRVLMELCDHVLLVVPYGKANEQEIINASKLIPKKKFMGIVFNDEPRLRSGK